MVFFFLHLDMGWGESAIINLLEKKGNTRSAKSTVNPQAIEGLWSWMPPVPQFQDIDCREARSLSCRHPKRESVNWRNFTCFIDPKIRGLIWKTPVFKVFNGKPLKNMLRKFYKDFVPSIQGFCSPMHLPRLIFGPIWGSWTPSLESKSGIETTSVPCITEPQGLESIYHGHWSTWPWVSYQL